MAAVQAASPSTTTPQAIVFDLDGVLADFDPAARTALLAAHTGCEPDRLQALFNGRAEQAAERGAFAHGAAHLAALQAELAAPLPAALWLAARRAATRERVALLPLLRRLCAQRVVAVLTNNGPLLREQAPQLVPQLAALFGPQFVVSCDLGARKPQAAVFERMAARLGVPPHGVMLVDDSAANCAGAVAAGWQAQRVAAAPEVAALIERWL